MSNKGLFPFLSPLSPNDDVSKPGYHGRGSWAFIQKTVTLKQRSILKILVNSWLKLRKHRESMAIVLTPKKNRLKRKTKRPTKINKCTKANKSEQTENLSTGAVNATNFSSRQKARPWVRDHQHQRKKVTICKENIPSLAYAWSIRQLLNSKIVYNSHGETRCRHVEIKQYEI